MTELGYMQIRMNTRGWGVFKPEVGIVSGGCFGVPLNRDYDEPWMSSILS